MVQQGVDWAGLIDEVLLEGITSYATRPTSEVDVVALAGSYTRGTWNPTRPNVNVYFISTPGSSRQVRAELGLEFARIRERLRLRGAVDLLIDCHPFTISQRDAAWASAPLLTLTTKVFDGADADQRFHMPTTKGRGWHRTHRILVGPHDALDQFALPAPRDEAWFQAGHAAMENYRNILDHLPWAIDPTRDTRQFIEESCRYAEEVLRDGVLFAVTDEELEEGFNLTVLHNWASDGREFLVSRMGPDGGLAVDLVQRLKASILETVHDVERALALWGDALAVWDIVWTQFQVLVDEAQPSAPGLHHVLSWA